MEPFSGLPFGLPRHGSMSAQSTGPRLRAAGGRHALPGPLGADAPSEAKKPSNGPSDPKVRFPAEETMKPKKRGIGQELVCKKQKLRPQSLKRNILQIGKIWVFVALRIAGTPKASTGSNQSPYCPFCTHRRCPVNILFASHHVWGMKLNGGPFTVHHSGGDLCTHQHSSGGLLKFLAICTTRVIGRDSLEQTPQGSVALRDREPFLQTYSRALCGPAERDAAVAVCLLACVLVWLPFFLCAVVCLLACLLACLRACLVVFFFVCLSACLFVCFFFFFVLCVCARLFVYLLACVHVWCCCSVSVCLLVSFSFCVCGCLLARLPAGLLAGLLACLFGCLFLSLCVPLSLCLFVCLRFFICLLACVHVWCCCVVSVCLLVSFSFCVCVRLFACLLACLFGCLFLYLLVRFCLFVFFVCG